MSIPRERTLDSSAAFLREGYMFVSNRCRRLGSDAFETRLMLRPAVCMQGPEPARVFYAHGLTRRGAMPPTALTLLQDYGSVMTLDGDEHRRRKRVFLDFNSPVELERLGTLLRDDWRVAVERWRRADHVVLLPAAEEVLCRTICAWAGVPLGEPEALRRTDDLRALIDGAGSVGLRQLRGQAHRVVAERWLRDVIARIRAGSLAADTPAGSLAAALPDDRVAAVELLNVLRPAVAVARYVVFTALALYEHPELRDAELGEPFVHEVRRYYPFFPAIAGRVVEPFEWRGRRFARGERVLLDLYGTNRHPDAWEQPDEFRAEWFAGWAGDPYTLVPQGGGDHATGHRCPGEWMTIELMKVAAQELAALRYDVPPQDLEIRPSRTPPGPESGFVMRNVQPRWPG